MSTTIGEVTLDRDLVFVNEYDYSLVDAFVTKTIGGGVVIHELEVVEKGRKIILSSSETQGLQLKSTVDALMAICNSGAYNTYPLSIVSNEKEFSRTVRFMHEIGESPIKAEPIIQRDGFHSDSVFYKVELNLMEV